MEDNQGRYKDICYKCGKRRYLIGTLCQNCRNKAENKQKAKQQKPMYTYKLQKLRTQTGRSSKTWLSTQANDYRSVR